MNDFREEHCAPARWAPQLCKMSASSCISGISWFQPLFPWGGYAAEGVGKPGHKSHPKPPKAIPKLYQSHTEPHQSHLKATQSQLIANRKPHQSHIKAISKPYQSHTKAIPTPYLYRS